MMRFVDVLQSALLETLSKGVVLFLSDVIVGLVQELQSPGETAAPIHLRIDGRMIVQILAIVDGGLLVFVDGIVDFMKSFFLLLFQFAAIGTLQMSACVPKI